MFSFLICECTDKIHNIKDEIDSFGIGFLKDPERETPELKCIDGEDMDGSHPSKKN